MNRTTTVLAWSDRLSLGIPEIDADHRRLIELANQLSEALLGQSSKSDVERILGAMLNEAEAHFRREERLLLKDLGAAGARHAELHADLVARLARLGAEFEAGQYSALWLGKAAAIGRLLVRHMIEEDGRGA